MNREKDSLRQRLGISVPALLLAGVLSAIAAHNTLAQSESPRQIRTSSMAGETTQDYNRRLQELLRPPDTQKAFASATEYRIGPEDLLELSVMDAPDLTRAVRVSGGGEISLPLLGVVKAADLTPRELEIVLQELLRRIYMKDPHVGVFVREMQSHSVSVVGAVRKPGVFQIRGAKTVLEMLSMAEGLAEDAGDTVYVMRGARLEEPALLAVQNAAPGNITLPITDTPSPASGGLDPAGTPSQIPSREINLKELLESPDPRNNFIVYPGDIVKVARAGIIYVVGEVKKPGGFLLKTNENISVLQALALGEGLTHTAATSKARIIRTLDQSGKRTEIPVDLGQVLSGKASDPLLHPKDILFVPNSGAKSALYRAGDAAISIVSGVIIWRR